MKVIALKDGYDGKVVRKAGTTFEWSKEACPKWCKPAGKGEAKAAEAEGGVDAQAEKKPAAKAKAKAK